MPGIRNRPQLLNLTGSEVDEITKLVADKKELLAINKAKNILAKKA